MLQAKEDNKKPQATTVKGMSMTGCRLSQLWDKLQVHNGTLWREYDDSSGKKKWLQLVVPTNLKQDVLQEIHESVVSGHLGEQKMIHQLKERFTGLE